MMTENNQKPSTVSEYIAVFPAPVQEILERIRSFVQAAVPEAEERISYGMPTYRLDGNLVHFAAYKNHIGFYPTPSVIEKFKDELAPYRWSKGSIQFPLAEPVPYDLIRRMVEFRVREMHLKNKK